MMTRPGGGGGEGQLKLIDLGLCRSVGHRRAAVAAAAAGPERVQDDGADEPSPALARQLTAHVVTRWYRAPELLFPCFVAAGSAEQYGLAVDLWSVGCILAEWLLEAAAAATAAAEAESAQPDLLGQVAQHEASASGLAAAAGPPVQRARPLFAAAQSALPLSPGAGKAGKRQRLSGGAARGRRPATDLLEVIVAVVGWSGPPTGGDPAPVPDALGTAAAGAKAPTQSGGPDAKAANAVAQQQLPERGAGASAKAAEHISAAVAHLQQIQALKQRQRLAAVARPGGGEQRRRWQPGDGGGGSSTLTEYLARLAPRPSRLAAVIGRGAGENGLALLVALLSLDPAGRPTVASALAHPFLSAGGAVVEPAGLEAGRRVGLHGASGMGGGAGGGGGDDGAALARATSLGELEVAVAADDVDMLVRLLLAEVKLIGTGAES